MLIDGHGREIDYLRISVTERCNLRCLYCMDEKPFAWIPHENILTYEEMFLFVQKAIDRGVKKIRLTGGEPLVRPDLDVFIKMIKDYKEDADIALTTNGFLLENLAERLSAAGLKRINISLDSLKRDVLHQISKTDVLENVLNGIEKSLECGFKVKLNMVPMKNINDNEILDIFEYAKSRKIMIRFIEYMENSFASTSIKGLNLDEISDAIKERYEFEEIPKNHSSPAKLFETKDGYMFGVIAPHNHDFCESCNRLRISAEGLLIPCLYFDEAVSLKDALRAKDMSKVENAIDEVLQNKPKENRWRKDTKNQVSSRAFYHTGG